MVTELSKQELPIETPLKRQKKKKNGVKADKLG